MIGLAHRGFALNDYRMHLANYLGSLGYETVLCGIQHEAQKAETIGYHKLLQQERGTGMYISDPSEYDLDSAGKAAAYIRSRKERKGDFFLSFGMINTHRKFPTVQGTPGQAYVQPPFVLYDNQTNREDMAGYIASASVADTCVGIVLEAIRETGLDDNSVIIFTTDHGIAFPNMKCHLYDTGIGVALMIKYPGNPGAGTALDALVSQVDIFPTLCDLSGLEKPNWLGGVSLIPVLEGKKEEVNEAVFSELTYHASYEPKRCIRTNRYKLIRHFDYHNQLPPCNTDNGPSKGFMMDAGMFKRPIPREQLFDLWLDPVERENVAEHSEYLPVFNDLSARLWDWMEKTNDPLINVAYRIPAPSGARINVLNCLQAEYQEYEDHSPKLG
jgi:arylsulfatase A-like enzyme